jgi:microcystin degradation protein MlrC
MNGGYGHADIAKVGPTVLVSGQGDCEAHRRFADEIADDFCSKRGDMTNTFLSVEEAATEYRQHDGSAGLIIVADYADNPGSRGYGDSTELLRALLAAGVKNTWPHPSSMQKQSQP